MVSKAENKKINILGICVDNYTVRESLLRLDTYMGSTVLNIIETVTMKQLILSGEHPAIKDCLEQADLCIVGECEILSETDSVSAQRMREVKNQDFLYELLKYIMRNHKRIFLIAMTNAQIEQMQEIFLDRIPQFIAVGSYAIEASPQDLDTIINEINGATPDIVISALDSPVEEEFVLSHKDKIGTSLWYGIGASYSQNQGMIRVGRTIQKLALRGRLHHSVSKYLQNEKKDRK